MLFPPVTRPVILMAGCRAQVAAAYDVRYLADYVAAYQETLRQSICSGNGVRPLIPGQGGIASSSSSDAAAAGFAFDAGGTLPGGCVCDPGFVGDNCQFACPACIPGRGVCATNELGTGASCNCTAPFGGYTCDLLCPDCPSDPALTLMSHCVPAPIPSAQPLRPPATVPYVCLCAPGRTGGFCQLPCSPMCVSNTSVCNSTTYFGYPDPATFPGTEAACVCAANHTGITCALACITCGPHGSCSHALAAPPLALSAATPQTIAGDAATCACSDGWVGPACNKPCPGNPADAQQPGNATCSGRGTCSDFAVTSPVGACLPCFSGFKGMDCEQFVGAVGDRVINANEQCDDGNTASGDGCDSAGRLEAKFTCAWTVRPDVRYVKGLYYPYQWYGVATAQAALVYTEMLTVVDKAFYSVCTCNGLLVNGACI